MGPYSSLSNEELAKRCCISGEKAAWEEFVQRFHRLIAKVVLRTAVRFGDPSRETVDDLIQETYLKFCADNCRLLRDFDHRHPGALTGYVQIVAANVARDHFKASYSKKRGEDRAQQIPDNLAPAAGEESYGSQNAIERAVLIQEVQRQLDHCIAGVDRDRNGRVFWLYYRAGLSAGAIAALPEIGLSTKGVESLILRITREIRQRMAAAHPNVSNQTLRIDEGVRPAKSF